MRFIEPGEGKEFHLTQVLPDENVDFRMPVKDPYAGAEVSDIIKRLQELKIQEEELYTAANDFPDITISKETTGNGTKEN